MNFGMIQRLTFLFTLACFSVPVMAKQGVPVSPSFAAKHLGIDSHDEKYLVGVIETVEQTDQYTYLKLKVKKPTKGPSPFEDVVWLATQRFEPEVGSMARFLPNAPMLGFKSKLLKRTFDKIYFVSELEIGKRPAH